MFRLAVRQSCGCGANPQHSAATLRGALLKRDDLLSQYIDQFTIFHSHLALSVIAFVRLSLASISCGMPEVLASMVGLSLGHSLSR